MTRKTCQSEKRKSAPSRKRPCPQMKKIATMQSSAASRRGGAGGTFPRVSTGESIIRRTTQVPARSNKAMSSPEKKSAL